MTTRSSLVSPKMTAVVLIALACALAGCGRKGGLDLPPGASLMDLSRLGLELEDALGRSVDLVTSFEALHPIIQERLRREGSFLL